MPPLLDALMSYVPWLVAKQFVDDPAPLSEAHTEEFEAAVFFADVSGFSKLAKHLSSEEGSEGPEHLTLMLNRYFGGLIDLIWQHGGDVVKFAGDAIYAVWPTTAHQSSLVEMTHAAVQCAVLTQDQLKNYTLETGHILSLKIGVAAGDVTASMVGGVLKRWELLLVGRPIGDVNSASELAAPGEIVISDSAYQLIKADVETNQIAVPDASAPFQRVQALLEKYPTLPIPQPTLQEAATRGLSGFVAGAITSRLSANQGEWVAENRRISVLFIQIQGITQAMEDVIERMNGVMRSMQLGLYHHEGSVRQFIVDDKGTVFIAAFGIPPLTHEDDPLRAVRAADEIRHKINELGYGCKIGISTGIAFCGPVGNRIRREYAMVGDVVVLSARLMSVAPPNNIICDEATYQYARQQIKFSELTPMPLKGFDQPVKMYSPSFDDRSVQPPSTILGRESEIAHVDDILMAVKDGEPHTLLIIGDDGSGKSGVLETLALHARTHKFRVLFGKGEFVDRATPYSGWRDPLSAIFEVSNLSKTRSRSLTILAKLAIEPELARLAPLLNTILPLDIPETEETSAMTGETRAENMRWLLMQILSLHSRNRPMVIVLDDAHWMDSASWAFARAIAQNMPSVLIVMSYRSDSKLPTEGVQLRALPQTIEVELAPLDRDRTADLIAQRLGATSVADRVVDVVYQQAKGNLLFTDQLVYALRDGGYVEVNNGNCQLKPEIKSLEELEIPRSLQDVMISRIDRLPPSLQLTLKVASVIGESFLEQTIRDIFPIVSERDKVLGYLNDLESLDFIEHVAAEDQLQFKQRLVRDVAYDLMLFSQRRELHLEIAKWYERNYVYDLSPFYGLLAYHWSEGGDNDAAVGYFEKAAQKAMFDGAFPEVIGFLSQAASLAGDDNTTRRTRWSELLGEAYWGTGNLEGSREEATQVLASLGFTYSGDPSVVRQQVRREILTQLLHRSFPGRYIGKSSQRRGIDLQAVRAFRRLQEVYYFNNNGLMSLYMGLRTLNLADQIGGQTPELAIARANFVVSMGVLGRHGQAEYYAGQAIESLKQLNDTITTSTVYTRLGFYHASRGQWAVAHNYLNDAIQGCRGQSNTQGLGEALTLSAFTYLLQGDIHAATTQFEQLSSVAAISSNGEFLGWTRSGEGLLALLRGEYDIALNALTAAEQLLVDSPTRVSYVNTLGVIALTCAIQQDRVAAIETIDKIDELLANRSLLSYIGFGAYAYRVSALLRLSESDPNMDLTKVDDYLVALKQFSDTFVIVQPRYLLLQAMVLAKRGKDARSALHKARQVAIKYQANYDAAAINIQLGRMYNDTAALEAGQQYFDSMGIRMDDGRLSIV